MKNKNIIYLLALIIMFILPGVSFADDAQNQQNQIPTNPPESLQNRTLEQELEIPNYQLQLSGNERMYTVQTGQLCPATGTLLNAEAVAWLETQIRTMRAYYATQNNSRMNELRTTARFEWQTIVAQWNTDRQFYETRIEALERQNGLLSQQNNVLRTGVPINRHAVRRRRTRTAFIVIGSIVVSGAASSLATYLIVK